MSHKLYVQLEGRRPLKMGVTLKIYDEVLNILYKNLNLDKLKEKQTK